jgi:hypothetical protein
MTTNNPLAQYTPMSLIYDDDSVLFMNLANRQEVWAFREYGGGKYNGNFQLPDGTLIGLLPNSKQAQPIFVSSLQRILETSDQGKGA